MRHTAEEDGGNIGPEPSVAHGPDDADRVDQLFSLVGRVALVTGGTGGLGCSIARGLAEAGATTVLASRNLDECRTAAAELSAATDTESVGEVIDVTDEARVGRAFAAVMERFGRLDVVVNSAGINARHPIEDCPLDDFEHVLQVNLVGTWLCCREAGRMMRPARRGSVVNLGSALSAIGMPSRTPYCSSKAGVVGLTQAVALEWAGSGLRCNALCPGPFLTEMNLSVAADTLSASALVGRTALNRWANIEEIRGPALFLASDASSYVTGTTLFVDGGWTAQ